MNTKNFVINKSPTKENGSVTLEQKYFGKVPNLSSLRIFGCLGFVHIPKESRRKLESKTKRYLFLGYDGKSKAYRLFDSNSRKVYISKGFLTNPK